MSNKKYIVAVCCENDNRIVHVTAPDERRALILAVPGSESYLNPDWEVTELIYQLRIADIFASEPEEI